MRRALGWLVVAAVWVGAAGAVAPVAPSGHRAELIAEDACVQLDRSTTRVVLEPTVATDAPSVALLVPLPAGATAPTPVERGATETARQLTTLPARIVWRRRWVPSTTVGAWRAWRAGPYRAAVPQSTVRTAPAAPTGRIAELPDAVEAAASALTATGLAVNAELRDWLSGQQAAGRRVYQVSYDTPGSGLRAVPLGALAMTYPSAQGFVPFSEPQLADDTEASATERPYRLAVFGATRLLPVWPDGYAIFPRLALQYACAVRREDWPADLPFAADGGAYLTYYEANVPRTARQQDIVLQPDEGGDVTPTATAERLVRTPVPLDLPAAVLLVALVLRRRHSARARSR